MTIGDIVGAIFNEGFRRYYGSEKAEDSDKIEFTNEEGTFRFTFDGDPTSPFSLDYEFIGGNLRLKDLTDCESARSRIVEYNKRMVYLEENDLQDDDSGLEERIYIPGQWEAELREMHRRLMYRRAWLTASAK